MGKKPSNQPSEKASTSATRARALMIETIEKSREKCENGDLKAQIVAIDLLCITRAPLPFWLADVLQKPLQRQFDAEVVGHGKKATRAARKNLNWVDWQRFILVNRNIRKLRDAGEKPLKKKAYRLKETDELKKSGVWGKWRTIQASYLQVERDLRDPTIDFEDYYPGHIEDVVQIFADVQD